ncbi:hypothetical protein LAD45_24725 [Escherichia coli]|uniref:hypothetical protein n=1 Tax=Escherichia coli TaxID=562 RepID=UPI0022721388|nr:hypothetical protein [Escherichia coli]MCX9965197.1 hypothetical protein [Escherichia coli]
MPSNSPSGSLPRDPGQVREGGADMLGSSGNQTAPTEAAVHTAPRGANDSEEPPERSVRLLG